VADDGRIPLRRWAAIAGSGLLAWLAWWGWQPEDGAAANQTAAESVEKGQLRIHDLDWLDYGADGRPRQRLQAELATREAKGQAMQLETLRLEWLSAPGSLLPQMMEAGRGLWSAQQDRIGLSGGIRLRHQTPELTLQMNDALLDLNRQQVASQAIVRLEGPRLEVEASGMQLDLAKGQLHLLDAVQSRHHPALDDSPDPAARLLEIRSRQALLDRSQGTMHYQGQVTLHEGTMEIHAQSMVLSNDPEQGQQLEAWGKPVQFRRRATPTGEEVTASAAWLRYLPQEGRLIMREQATMNRRQLKLQGEQIEYNLRNGQAMVIKATVETPPAKQWASPNPQILKPPPAP